jgi:hypothetical protein
MEMLCRPKDKCIHKFAGAKKMGFSFLRLPPMGPTYWKVSPQDTVSVTAPTKFVISVSGETGNFAVANEKSGDKFMLDYTIGGPGLGISPPGLPDAQYFPASWPSGSFGTIWRIPPYAPKESLPHVIGAPGGYGPPLKKYGGPTGLEGGSMVIAGGAAAGVIPGLAGSIGYMFMGFNGAPATVKQSFDKVLKDAAGRIALNVALSFAGPSGAFLSLVKEFNYVTLVWCTGLSTPTASAGVTAKFGRVYNLRKV